METRQYTFKSLFSEINKIEIPIIQRDYAQGRKDEKVERVREPFLDTIFDALKNQKTLTLDFVYGEKENGKFIPLDGQQRLTTLFLLHWYIAKKECVNSEESDFLKGFSYFTRPSSRDFCQSLVDFTPSFSKIISEEIKDQSWFQYQWNNDPTIEAMLVMIDAINGKYDNSSDLWKQLEYITFYFLEISEMGLSDELYIKMNSRGKPLTEFEHFKAEFEGMVNEVDKKLSEEFNHKFDLDWTDMLFPYRGENKIIDDEFMRYFFFVSDILCFLQGSDLQKDEFKLAKLLYGKDKPQAKENLEFLKRAFDCWRGFNIDDFFNTIFANNVYESGKVTIYQDQLNIFKQCCDDYGDDNGRNRKFPLSMTLLLYAVVVYLQNKQSVQEEDFKHRIRIVRNLIWNSRDEIRADGQRNNMPQLLAETKEIILQGTIPTSTGYNKRQKEEEQAKIDWLQTNLDKQDTLFRLEDHSLLYGCIAVVGLENITNFDKFRELFNICDKDLISRALLAKGDYSQIVGWRWQLGTKNNSTWEDLFHPSKQRKGFDNTTNVLNNLLANLTTIDANELHNVIDTYLNNPSTLKDLRYYFVKYANPILSNRRWPSTYGFYYTYEDGDYHTLRMNTEKSLGGRNWNVFILTLYYQLNKKYQLDDFAYQGNKLQLSDDLWLDCLNDKFVFYKWNNDQWKIDLEIPIPQDENGIDSVDRIEFMKKRIEIMGQ
ncbi:MAG: DUF262 domain-containing protein [Paludibacteraceae bacterium]|nr:DUF262 domain-containing protein [Paludibacteraceae bacterium]